MARGGSFISESLGQVRFWFLALFLGTAAGAAAVLFRVGIERLQGFLYGTDNIARLHSHAATLPWAVVLCLPVLGGLLVGLILHYATPDGRVRSVADVIEGAALNEGRVERRAGVASALASLITLSSGGSSGREGPVVHLAALISSWISRVMGADGITGRDLLGCAVAAAVSASFNAPIAGALFALEVVLRHFAVHAFAPIVVASVAGTVVSRLSLGDVTEFTLPGTSALAFYIELPAFFLLGLLCGLGSVVFMRAIFWADRFQSRVQARVGLPRWARPALAGVLLGLLAIPFPIIIGVGYETTSAALTGSLSMREAMVFACVKALAVVITIAGRMGGGIFSPSLMMGALTGLAFGLIATGVFPEMSGSHTLYALAGMGAFAAAVLGAPISTTLIVFELTGDWQTGLAVMVSVSLSTALASRLVDRSFFLTQLEQRGVRVAAGPQRYLLGMYRVLPLARALGSEGCPARERLEAALDNGPSIDAHATLETAMPLLESSPLGYLPVMRKPAAPGAPPELAGALFLVDALRTYNRAMAAAAEEEHS